MARSGGSTARRTKGAASRRPRATAPLPAVLEATLVGAWLAVVVAAWTLPETPLARARTGLAEALLGVFLLLFALRRGERGLALVAPFAALVLAVATGVVLHPEMEKLGAAGLRDGMKLVRHVAGAIDIAKVCVLVACLVRCFPAATRPAGR